MNVLFTGIGGPTPLGLAKSIKVAFPSARCIGVDGSKWAASLYSSDIFDITYQIESGSSLNYWNRMEEVIDRENIDFAFIVPETEVLIWSKKQEEGILPCRALIPHLSLSEFCFDKAKVAGILYSAGLTPKTIEYNQAGNSLLEFPFWIRVKSGAGALGALKVNNPTDLDTWLTLHNNRKDFMISEFLPGRNYACKLLYVDNKLIQHASAERIDYLLAAAAPSGISGMCARGKLLNRADLVQKSKDALDIIAKKLNVYLHGIFTIDFKENLDGEPMITEINIRHVSFNYAFTLGGINFAKTTIESILIEEHYQVAPPVCFEQESFFIRGVDAPLRLIL